MEGNLQTRGEQVTRGKANKCEIEGGWSITQGFSVDHFVNGDIECGPNQDVGHGLIQYDRENNSVSYIGADGKECSRSVGPIESGARLTIRDGKDLGWIRFTVGRLPKQTGIAKLNFFYDDKEEKTEESNETERKSALPFTYTDDICQIGEHDVCFSGIELTQDVGEFKAGTKFACAVIDFQAGHLTLEEHHGREHRYDFALKVGAKHEGHTCTGCGSVVGQPCRQHA